jgi:type I restriction enzyme S subunit
MNKVLPKNWSYKKLNQLGFVGRGKSKHRPRNEPSLFGGIYPFIQTGEVKAVDLYISKYSQTYNEKGLAQSKLWQANTLLITIAANIADTAILKFQACFPDSIVGFIANSKESDVRFVKYYIDTLKLQMQNISRGTTQDNLSLDKLLSFDFLVPHVSTQQRIASILSAYDDLIENNTRRIKILEEMAQMLYREWFVNFRFPNHENVKMVESELGLIPQGWEVTSLEKILKLTHGYGFKSEHLSKEKTSYVVVRMGNFKETGGLQVEHNIRYIEPDSFNKKYLLKPDDLVMAFSDVTRSGGIIGNVGLIPNDNSHYVLNQRVLKIDLPENLKMFFYIYFNSESFKNHCLSRADSATVLNLKNEHIYQHQVVLPSQEILSYFIRNFEPIIRKIQNLDKKNINLRKTRDLLLPKLISGEIDVENLNIETLEIAA